ncbi:AAA domain-containing protein [Bacillus sp. REN10]|uniref:AAA domain-containing protein n=1 Tax=Bacillus sp. REN10 TaxID=2782541 RepID=UPI00193BFBFB|nr:AAA domain-containing protein [Bacillus sp. REN10]
MDLKKIMKEWANALALEIKELKQQEGRGLPLIEGECIESSSEKAIYHFKSLLDMRLPEGVPVRIETANEQIKGTVLSCYGKEITIELQSLMSDDIEEAELFSEPWELLQKLSERLQEAGETAKGVSRMNRLLHPSTPDQHPKEKVKSPVHEAALRAQYNPITYIWGPPGTGKTFTLARIAARHYVNKKKVLIVSHSNAAVDVLLMELMQFLKSRQKWSSGDVIRYSHASAAQAAELNEMLPDKLMEHRHPALYSQYIQQKMNYRISGEDINDRHSQQAIKEWKEKREQTVERASVIGVTLSKAALDPFIYENEFDLVIIDEASMAFTPQLAFAATLGRHTVVCGDFKQLPPIAVSSHPLVRKWLKQDIFFHSGIAESASSSQGHPHLFMLNTQRRMHPHISAFTNKEFYDGKVKDAPSLEKDRRSIVLKAPFPGEAMTLVDTSGAWPDALKEQYSASKYNLTSLLIALQLFSEAKASGVQTVGFISPYRIQTQLMNACLAELFSEEWANQSFTAATVHKFQGSERDLIIFDAVDAPPQLISGGLLRGKESERLMNVAMTRAKGKFILLANQAFFQKTMAPHEKLRRLLYYLETTKQTYQLEQLFHKKESLNKAITHVVKEEESLWLKDLLKAKQSIIIGLPPKSKPNKQFWSAVKRQQSKCSIKLLCKLKKVPFSNVELVAEAVPFPFMIIDANIFWLGAPLRKEQTPNVRLQCKTFIQHFLKAFSTKNNRLELKELLKSTKKRSFILSREQLLHEYVDLYSRCPICSHKQQIRMTQQKYVRLECSHCEQGEFLSKQLLQHYLSAVGAKCIACDSTLQAEWTGEKIAAVCTTCHQEILPFQFVE